MKSMRSTFPVLRMAKVLGVCPAGFYDWLKREPSARSQRNKKLMEEIRKVHQESRQTYGPIRIRQELASMGIHVGRDHIGRLRKEMGLNCAQKRKYRVTTDSDHDLPHWPNLLDRQFSPPSPQSAYATDITFVWTDEGWLYLAGVLDLGTCEIVGWAVGKNINTDLVLRAMRKAVGFRPPQEDAIHHSDRGSQYCSNAYTGYLKSLGMRISMSRKGNCWDNAPMESFWGTLKQELIHRMRYRTRVEATASIAEYIEVFYNRIRRHSSIGGVAPSKFYETIMSEKKYA